MGFGQRIWRRQGDFGQCLVRRQGGFRAVIREEAQWVLGGVEEAGSACFGLWEVVLSIGILVSILGRGRLVSGSFLGA